MSKMDSSPIVMAWARFDDGTQVAGGVYKSETAWNDNYGSSNGGYSKLFARPSYQNGFVSSSRRGVPDVINGRRAADPPPAQRSRVLAEERLLHACGKLERVGGHRAEGSDPSQGRHDEECVRAHGSMVGRAAY